MTSNYWFVEERLKSIHVDSDTKPLALIRADADNKLDTTNDAFMSATSATVGIYIGEVEKVFNIPLAKGVDETTAIATMKGWRAKVSALRGKEVSTLYLILQELPVELMIGSTLTEVGKYTG